MSYIDTHLLNNENVQFRTHLHWIIFITPLLWFLVSLFFYAYQPQLPYLYWFGLLLGVIYSISAFIDYTCSEFGVTNQRILIKVGFIRINSIETLLDKIESIQVKQSILGRLLNYGNIIVCGTGGSRDWFYNIADPLLFRKMVQEKIEKNSLAEK